MVVSQPSNSGTLCVMHIGPRHQLARWDLSSSMVSAMRKQHGLVANSAYICSPACRVCTLHMCCKTPEQCVSYQNKHCCLPPKSASVQPSVPCTCAAAGNESPVTAYMKSAGLMFENREAFGALVLFIEVRTPAHDMSVTSSRHAQGVYSAQLTASLCHLHQVMLLPHDVASVLM